MDISYENESPGLQWLKAIYSQEEESTELSELEMDNDSNHASWHLTIRETKIKIEGEETEIGAQVRCLKKLYQKIKKDNCIEEQSKKDEAIFIYRFSGITTGSDMPWGGRKQN